MGVKCFIPDAGRDPLIIFFSLPPTPWRCGCSDVCYRWQSRQSPSRTKQKISAPRTIAATPSPLPSNPGFAEPITNDSYLLRCVDTPCYCTHRRGSKEIHIRSQSSSRLLDQNHRRSDPAAYLLLVAYTTRKGTMVSSFRVRILFVSAL